MTTPRIKHLTCCCCGGDAPALEQWWNRDTGFGMCGNCIQKIRTGKLGHIMDENEIKSCYGIEGKHWFAVAA